MAIVMLFKLERVLSVQNAVVSVLSLRYIVRDASEVE
jgi:hypothetical protein